MRPAQQDPLAQLRDIHLPEPVGIWPPAPGWWLLAALLLAAIVYGALRWWRYRRDNHYRRLALRQLHSLESSMAQPDDYLQALNALLKRTALAARFETPVAALSGSAWLDFLDRSGATDAFSNGVGQLLLEGPYAPPTMSANSDPSQQLKQLHQLAAHWIRQHKRIRQHKQTHQHAGTETSPC